MSIKYTHPEIAKEWHPTKNADLKITDITSGSGRKVWWLCPITCGEGCLHEYESIIAQRCTKNSGCQYCVQNTMKICIHMSITNTHREVAKLWHPYKNTHNDAVIGEYSPGNQTSPTKWTSGAHYKAWWLCPIKCSHECKHEWQTSIYHLTTDTGCPFCSNRKLCEHMSILYTHPEIANEWHPTKNQDIDIKLCSVGCNKSVWWLCKDKHEYKQIIYSRTLAKQGCPDCRYKTERILLNFLKKYYPYVYKQLKLDSCRSITTNRHYPFDFCIPSLKLIIELDGPQHFKQVSNWASPEESIQRDIYKMQKAEVEGYKVIRIFQEDVYDNDEKWLERNLLPEIQNEHRIPVFISSIDDLYDEHIKLYESGVD
jgi:very-short-patch-repair endonuclease